jgi:hypothetical protein
MKFIFKLRSALMIAPLLVAVVALTPAICIAATPTVNLGDATPFAVLAGTSISNIGPTVIEGDVGLSPGSSFTGQETVTVSGTVNIANDTAADAQDSWSAAYNEIDTRTPATRISGQLDGKTLYPGYYDSADGVFSLNGELFLDAQGNPNAVFVFRTTSTLVTSTDSSMIMLNAARPSRVFWQVGSSATLGNNSHFSGQILALTSITANSGAIINGQLMAGKGAVSLNSNTIIHDESIKAPRISLTKTANPSVLNNGPGMVTFTYQVSNPGVLPLSNILVTVDQASELQYFTGDVNYDGLLQPGEVWIYTGVSEVLRTVTTTAEAKGSANGLTANAFARVTVVVYPGSGTITPDFTFPATPDARVTPDTTVTGGTLPSTAANLFEVLIFGGMLVFVGLLILRSRKNYE